MSGYILNLMLVLELQCCQNSSIAKRSQKKLIPFFAFPVVAVKASLIGHLTFIPLVATYQHHSRKQPAQVTDTFSYPQRCLLTRTSTVVPLVPLQLLVI